MQPLSASDIIRIWEQGTGQHPLDRALTILAAACAEMTRAELADLSLGERDRHLLAVREQTLGAEMEGTAACPRCAERLEFKLTTAELRTGADGEDAAPDGENEIVVHGRRFAVRPPTSRLLASVAGCEDAERARRLLARRCLTPSDGGDASDAGDEISEETISEVERRVAAADPRAEMLLNLRCPACSHQWQLALDIAAWLWGELRALAMRLLAEVDALARVYGWAEREVLEMSAARRHAYLEMVA